MRASDLLESIYSDLHQHSTKLKTLGKGSKDESQLSLDSPESLARYAQIIRPNILAAIHSNRAKGRLVVGCLVALLAIACFLAVWGNVHNLRLVTAASIPGLGVAAWWPIAVLVRLRREDMALQMLPDLLPLLPPKEAAEVVKKLLLSSLTSSDTRGKPWSMPQATVLLLCFVLSCGTALRTRAQEGPRVEPRAEAKPRSDLIDRMRNAAKAKDFARVESLFRGETSPAVRGALLEEAARSGHWDEPGARANALSLARKPEGKYEQNAIGEHLARQARAFLDLGDLLLLERADHSYAAGDLKSAERQYKELLDDPQLSWDTRAHAEGALRDSLFTLGLHSYRAQAWDDAASALSDFVDRVSANDLRNRQTVEMLAKSLMQAGVSAYSNRHWLSASLAFEKFNENSPGDSSAGSSTAQSMLWSEFHKYVRSVPGMREQARLYRSRARHLADVVNMPHGIAVIDVIPEDNSAAPVHGPPERRYALHVFDSTGELDLVVSGKNLRQAVASPGFRSSAADTPAISSVVLTPMAKGTAEDSLDIQSLFPDKVVWHASSIREAAENLQALKASRPKIADLSLAMLLPRNEDQKQKLGLQDWSSEDQQRTWESAQHFLDQSGINDVITERVNRGGIMGWLYELFGVTKTQERLFDALTQKKNVLIFIAHGDREHLYTPDGAHVAVSDIQKLNLGTNRPAVFLFSCEGGKTARSDSGPALADALKNAGAGAVWSFEEKLDAGEAMSAAASFLDDLKRGQSMMDAIQTLAQTLRKLGAPKTYLRVQTDPSAYPAAKTIGDCIKAAHKS